MDVFEEFLTKRFAPVRVADDTKDPCEREEDDVEEHMTGRDRPHSRDQAGHGLPAAWNERKRVEQDDPDVTADVRVDKNPDTSLNYKSSARKKRDKKERPPPKDLSRRIEKLGTRIGKSGQKFAANFEAAVAPDLRLLVENDPVKCASQLSKFEKIISDVEAEFSEVFKSSSSSKLPATIAEAWDEMSISTEGDALFRRAGIVEALKKAAMKVDLPDSIKIPVMRSHGKQVSDERAIKAILGSKDKISVFPEGEIDRLVALSTAHVHLLDYPKKIAPNQLKDEKLSKKIRAQVEAVVDFTKVTSAWQDAMSHFKVDESGHIDVSEGNWGAVLSKINGFMNKPAPPVNPSKYMHAMADQLKEKYGRVPDEIQALLKGYGSGESDTPVKSEGTEPKADPKKAEPSKDQRTNNDFYENDEDEAIGDAMAELAKRRKERENKKQPWRVDVDEAAKEFEEFEKSQKEEQGRKSKPPVRKPKAGPAMEEHEGEKPQAKHSPMLSISTRMSAASYEAVCRRMIHKSAAYHGIVYQGHPTDPAGSSPKSYDKRYFGKEHYDSIVASAKEFLGEDWLKYGWGENPGDVPVRAALDLAIHTADSGLYQSKIDAITYNMLLNQLAGWDYDIFNETLLGPKARKASVMVRNSSAYAILKIADSLRSDHPDLSIQIIKNVHALMRQAADPVSEPDQDEKKREDDERKLIEKVFNQVRAEKKLPPLQGKELEELVQQALAGLLEAGKPQGSSQGSSKMSALNDVQVLSVIIRMAAEHPEYRKCLPAVSVAAKKMKNKGKKKEEKKAEKKAPKEEEAPKPSVPTKKDKKDGKKKEPASKKKKASVILAASDINW